MTDENTTATDAESVVDDFNGTPEGEGAGEQNPRNKEARYRRERNEARAERDALAERLSVLQRAEVERLASAGLSQPSDLFTLSGNELADYLTEDGLVDAEKVRADVEAIIAERPGLSAHQRPVDHTQGYPGGGGKAKPSWAGLFAP
ncbi:hypothetical protein BST36_17350 [Mycolicibacterium moriokaense]|uniref:Scaffolding protein n=1 Tax=Mycolicibacterium moriokaense TaxID=39691 RepID=A0AAD1HHR6_9MYCO|nr:hypothetical protein [Mycolicibacterium moriokaense]MCV7037354.1 hypothetical protein [Mycolicibacterium moriokaense]ORB21255.1 hypothetical protein BST36_17350 [Mycolicibacterium moriokaense]BBX04313.1 hypothetical protein MMOR_52490 [Mycolicibacterium moriokaense]